MAKDRDISIEQSLPIVDINGLNTNKDTYLGGTLEVVGAQTFTGASTFASIAASGNATVGGTFRATGTSNLVGAVNAGSTITATGAISTVSTITAKNAASATAATGVQAFGFSNVANWGIYYGEGAPAATASTGSLYLRYDGGGTGTRAYMCAGGATWVGLISSS